MPTANETYLDAALRHQIGIRRYSSGLTNRIARLLEESDARLVKMLRERLPEFSSNGEVDFTSQRWQALIQDVREARAQALKAYRGISRSDLSDLSIIEKDKELAILVAAIPVEVDFAPVSSNKLRSIVSSRPFQGRLLKDWFRNLQRSDQERLQKVIQLGVQEGQTTDQIVQQVVGTKAKKYSDGILSTTRRDAQSIVRTAVNHISNTARSYVWEENSDIITAKIWVSTLDGRTSPICQDRDGKGATMRPGQELPEGVIRLIPRNARPPAHINCRSVMVAYINGIGIVGTRPTVTDTRTRRRREIDFRAQAKEQGKSIKEIRKKWAADNIGIVPAKTTYQDFLFRQSEEFQIGVLGVFRTKLFRSGKMTVHQFVDRQGDYLTIDQLRNSNPEAAQAIGG